MSNNFTLIDKDDNIIGCGRAPNWTEQADKEAGERVVLGRFPKDQYKVEDGVIVERTDDEKAEDRKEASILAALEQRRSMLASTDWTQMPDAPNRQRRNWRKYRQELRDMGDELRKDPENVVWPEPPA